MPPCPIVAVFWFPATGWLVGWLVARNKDCRALELVCRQLFKVQKTDFFLFWIISPWFLTSTTLKHGQEKNPGWPHSKIGLQKSGSTIVWTWKQWSLHVNTFHHNNNNCHPTPSGNAFAVHGNIWRGPKSRCHSSLWVYCRRLVVGFMLAAADSLVWHAKMVPIINMRKWADHQTWWPPLNEYSTTNLKIVLAVGGGINKETWLGQTFVGGCLPVV